MSTSLTEVNKFDNIVKSKETQFIDNDEKFITKLSMYIYSSSSDSDSDSDYDIDTKAEPITLPYPGKWGAMGMAFPVPKEMEKVQTLTDKQNRAFWVRNQISLADDVKNWNTICYKKPINKMEIDVNKRAKNLFSKILYFFAQADKIVMDNIQCNFQEEIKWIWFQNYYAAQEGIEAIHSQAYQMMVHAFMPNSKDREVAAKAITESKSITKKKKWIKKYMNKKTKSLAARMAAFVFIEGGFFSSSFAYIDKARAYRTLVGFCEYNDLISKDESLHTLAGIAFYRYYLVNHLKTTDLVKMATEAAEIELEFNKECLPLPLPGLSAADMAKYIKFTFHRLLVGLDPKAEKLSPYRFVTHKLKIAEESNLRKQSNFFEVDSHEYSAPITSKTTSSNKSVFISFLESDEL